MEALQTMHTQTSTITTLEATCERLYEQMVRSGIKPVVAPPGRAGAARAVARSPEKSRALVPVPSGTVSLSALDELLLLDIYPAREEPIPGITSKWLLEQVPMDAKECTSSEGLLSELAIRNVEVVVTLGAGDIDRLVPRIERLLNERYRP